MKSLEMKKKIWQIPVLLLFLGFLMLQPQQASAANKNYSTIKVLFVGNSKTARNDIPGKFQEIAAAMGKNVSVEQVTVGGKSLTHLANNYGKRIQQKKYDYVVLQERTAFLLNYSQYLKGAWKVTRLVQAENPKVQMVLRDMWVKSGSSKKQKQKAYDNSEKVASKINAKLSLDGQAFDLCQRLWPNIELFADEKHQSNEGAYLSACCVYRAIFGKAPLNCKYTAGIKTSRAKKLQKAAKYATK